jgi:hypothetical protein
VVIDGDGEVLKEKDAMRWHKKESNPFQEQTHKVAVPYFYAKKIILTYVI